MANTLYTRKQLLELDACTGCQACADICPAVSAAGDGKLSGVHRLAWMRQAFKGRGGVLRRLFGQKPPSDEDWDRFSETVYRCTLCGNCQEVCPAGIQLKEMWLTLRQELVQNQHYPEKINLIRENLEESHNVFNEDNSERADWVEDLDEEPEDGLVKDQADWVYFTGCVAAFFPLAQQVPVNLTQVLQAGKVDFTLLGEEEWCCGFPLLGAGLKDATAEIIAHNLAAVREKKAKGVVFACPSCYMMWREHYHAQGLELYHSTQFLQRLVLEGKLPFKKLNLKVTYHDPCDLGRGSREFDAPRAVIKAIPGVELLEMERNREQCLCCGGGGNLEMIDQELNKGIAKQKIDMALATGAEAIITSCQQCVRTMATYCRRNEVPLKVMDISQLVRKALDVEED